MLNDIKYLFTGDIGIKMAYVGTNLVYIKFKLPTCETDYFNCNYITCDECGEVYCTTHNGHPDVCCPIICGPKTTCEDGHKYCKIHEEHVHAEECNYPGCTKDIEIRCHQCRWLVL